jgi:hypothetical protein
MSWDNNQSIRFKIGAVALWNLLTKSVIDMRNPTLGVLKTHYDRRGALDQINEFEDMTTRELPTSMQEAQTRKEMYV